MDQALRTELFHARPLRRWSFLAGTFVVPLLFTATLASAEGGLLDFLFGGLHKQPTPQVSSYADPSQRSAPPLQIVPPLHSASAGGSGPAFCVRTCDGKYFPLMRGGMSPARMCRAFCPASPTSVYFGSSIESARTSAGKRYADSENAFAYRKALRSDCTCNGREPAGLAPVDLASDKSLRAGDVIATSDGLVAYNGARTGEEKAAEFIPIASYPGLTTEVRARLGEMKIVPVRAEPVASDTSVPDTDDDAEHSISVAPETPSPRSAMRAAVD